jgi:hypothetical protein
MREGLPLAGAFGLFAHLCLTGLAPHLEAREDLAKARHAALEEQAEIEREIERLTLQAEALNDPIYRERMRRALARPPAGQHFTPRNEFVPKQP